MLKSFLVECCMKNLLNQCAVSKTRNKLDKDESGRMEEMSGRVKKSSIHLNTFYSDAGKLFRR